MLASCSSAPTPPPQTFPPLNYSYLKPIPLNVASLTVVNNYVPTQSQAALLAQDPAPVPQVLTTLLNHLLVASGTPGTGTVTIQNASIDQQGTNLVGVITVDVHLVSGDGRRTADTEAAVNATAPAPDPSADQNTQQAALYDLTKQMIDPGSPDSFTVKLQQEIEVNLPDWVSATGPGSAPSSTGGPAVIQATPLTPPPPSTASTPPASTPPEGVLTLPPSMAPAP